MTAPTRAKVYVITAMMVRLRRPTTPDTSIPVKHFTSRAVERLIGAIKGSRNQARHRCLVLLMFRQGLLVSYE